MTLFGSHIPEIQPAYMGSLKYECEKFTKSAVTHLSALCDCVKI